MGNGSREPSQGSRGKKKKATMYQITLDGVPMWSVNGMNFLTKEEAERAEQEMLDYYKTHQCTGD